MRGLSELLGRTESAIHRFYLVCLLAWVLLRRDNDNVVLASGGCKHVGRIRYQLL